MRVERLLPAGAVAASMLCMLSCSPPPALKEFPWEGKVWKIQYEKALETNFLRPIDVITPDGHLVSPNDPKLPFTFVPTDFGLEPSIFGPFVPRTARAASSSPPFYAYVLSAVPNDAIYVFDQQTALLVSTINLPTLPTGLAVSNDGQRVYVGNQEVAAGNPFFPAAPPRISVIDKSTRSIIQTINLPGGKRLGKPVVSLDDRLLYVPNQGVFVPPGGYQGSSVLIIDTQSRSLIGEIPLNPPDLSLDRLVMTPDGSLIYSLKTKSSPMRAFVIDTTLREVAATITANISPTDVLMNHTGTRLYVLTADSVVVFDTATNTEIRRQLIRQNSRLNSMALSIDGGSLFVNPELGTSVFRLDSTALRVAEEISLGTRPPESSAVLVLP